MDVRMPMLRQTVWLGLKLLNNKRSRSQLAQKSKDMYTHRERKKQHVHEAVVVVQKRGARHEYKYKLAPCMENHIQDGNIYKSIYVIPFC